MSTTAILFGILLVLLGVYGIFGLGGKEKASIIPLLLGIIILALGIAEMFISAGKIIIIIEMLLMLSGFIINARKAFPKAFAGAFSAPVILQLIICAVCAIFVYLANSAIV
jgi:hypothetical protein